MSHCPCASHYDIAFRKKNEGMAALILNLGLFCTLDAGLLARSRYSEGPATGHLDTGFSWFACV